jgi:DNA-binding response OmpR family regulator
VKKVILIEDDPGIQDAVRLILELDNHDVEIFPNGLPILENKCNMPDLFILDRHLSGDDGLDICRFLKQQDKSRQIPVLILSANAQVRYQAKLAGADDFLEKPFQISDLRKLVALHLAKHVGQV